VKKCQDGFYTAQGNFAGLSTITIIGQKNAPSRQLLDTRGHRRFGQKHYTAIDQVDVQYLINGRPLPGRDVDGVRVWRVSKLGLMKNTLAWACGHA